MNKSEYIKTKIYIIKNNKYDIMYFKYYIGEEVRMFVMRILNKMVENDVMFDDRKDKKDLFKLVSASWTEGDDWVYPRAFYRRVRYYLGIDRTYNVLEPENSLKILEKEIWCEKNA